MKTLVMGIKPTSVTKFVSRCVAQDTKELVQFYLNGGTRRRDGSPT